jgi:hypothetical protein
MKISIILPPIFSAYFDFKTLSYLPQIETVDSIPYFPILPADLLFSEYLESYSNWFLYLTFT